MCVCVSVCIIIFLSLFLTVLGLHCCVWAFSGCGKQGLLSSVLRASHSGGFSCCGAQALGQSDFSGCGTRA